MELNCSIDDLIILFYKNGLSPVNYSDHIVNIYYTNDFRVLSKLKITGYESKPNEIELAKNIYVFSYTINKHIAKVHQLYVESKGETYNYIIPDGFDKLQFDVFPYKLSNSNIDIEFDSLFNLFFPTTFDESNNISHLNIEFINFYNEYMSNKDNHPFNVYGKFNYD